MGEEGGRGGGGGGGEGRGGEGGGGGGGGRWPSSRLGFGTIEYMNESFLWKVRGWV